MNNLTKKQSCSIYRHQRHLQYTCKLNKKKENKKKETILDKFIRKTTAREVKDQVKKGNKVCIWDIPFSFFPSVNFPWLILTSIKRIFLCPQIIKIRSKYEKVKSVLIYKSSWVGFRSWAQTHDIF